MPLFTFDSTDINNSADGSHVGSPLADVDVIVTDNANLIGDDVSPILLSGGDNDVFVAGDVWSSDVAAVAFFGVGNSMTVAEGGNVVNSSEDFGVVFQDATESTLSNAGHIVGRIAVAGLDAIDLTVVNSGTIQSNGWIEDSAAIALYQPHNNGNAEIFNSGVLMGSENTDECLAIFVEENNNLDVTLANTGTIVGNIRLQDGKDSITNTGIIAGRIDLGDGANEYRATGDGQVTSGVYGGTMRDILIGGSAADRFVGGDGDDIMRGRGDEDLLEGGAGLDQMYGGNDDDSLRGDGGNDRLFGNNGNDILDGGEDDDILRGGDGNDYMLGGTGRDVMFGGAGRDQFVFTTAADSVLGAGRDAIRDFQSGEDVFDLEDIAGGALSYRGTGVFTGSGPEVRHVTTAAGSSIVRIDVDGDGARDMEFLVQFTPSLSESDFVL